MYVRRPPKSMAPRPNPPRAPKTEIDALTLLPVAAQPATQSGRHAGPDRHRNPGWTPLGSRAERLAGRAAADLWAGGPLPGARPGPPLRCRCLARGDPGGPLPSRVRPGVRL